MLDDKKNILWVYSLVYRIFFHEFLQALDVEVQ
jgi:hypothetical protein